jgi:ribosomal subunit interface protein
MIKRIVFRGVDHSDLIEEYANKQLKKIEQFLENERTPIYIDLILEPSKLHQHSRVELRVKSPSYDLISTYEHEGVEFYEALDRVIDTMYFRLHEESKKRHDHLKDVGRHDDFKKQR